MALSRRCNARNIARGLASAFAAMMIYYFVFDDPIRADNPFLVADAVLVLLMLGAASVRGWLRTPMLIFSYGWAAGVWTVSLSTYAIRGEFAQGSIHIPLIAACLVGTGVLALDLARGHGRSDASATGPGRRSSART